MWYKIGVKMFYAFKFRFLVFIVFCFLFLLTDNEVFSTCSTNGFYFSYEPACDCVPETQCNLQTQTTEYSTCTSDRCQKLWWICDTPCVAPTIANDPYDYTKCSAGKYLSCGSSAEAVDQNKNFCGYRITCNKDYWPSSIDLPAPCNQNPVSATCNWNCSCCSTGTSRSCTTGAIYNREITIDKTNYTALEIAKAKTTCNTHDDIFIDNTLIRAYTNKWDEQLEDWRIRCRENTCVCRAQPTSTPTPTPTPWIRVNVKDTDGTYHISSGICGVDCTGTICTKKGSTSIYCSSNDASFIFPKFTAINTYIGGRIELTDNLSRPLVVVGVTPSVAGFLETTCNNIEGYCYVWNKNSWTTGGRTVDFVVAIPTNTPTPTATLTPTPTIAALPGPWIKLKDTSFISDNNLNSNIPAVPVAYDSDDTPANANFIRDVAGIVAAPAIGITGLNATAKTGSPEYKTTGYSPAFLMTPSSFLSYIKARKQHKAITSLAEINVDGIYLWQGVDPLPINDGNKARFDGFKVVLISTGTVNINTDNGLDPVNGSLAIIAPTITFHSVVEEANGLFIANSITTGNTTNQGLKIIGNLIAQTSFTNSRDWTNANIPSLFIVFDQQKYISLLPYLSTANYDWRQIQ
jgi:hypothetical protein